MAERQPEELRIARLIEFRGIAVPSDKLKEIPSMISSLSDLAHENAKKSGLNGRVSVREVFLSSEGRDAYGSPLEFVDLAHVIDYAEKDGVSVQQAIDDTRLFRDGAEKSMFVKGAELRTRSGRLYDYSLSVPLGHDFGCIPLAGRLSGNFHNINVQKNDFGFGARVELTNNEVDAIREVMANNGMKYSLRQSTQTHKPDANGFEALFELNSGLGTTYNMRAPEIVLDAHWEGPDFSRKVWKAYGELRKAVYPKYLETSLKYASSMMNHAILAAAQGNPRSIALNQERLNRGPSMKDIWCTFGTEIPVIAGGEKSIFHVDYERRFLGDCH